MLETLYKEGFCDLLSFTEAPENAEPGTEGEIEVGMVLEKIL